MPLGQTTFYDIDLQQKAGQIMKYNRGLFPIDIRLFLFIPAIGKLKTGQEVRVLESGRA